MENFAALVSKVIEASRNNKDATVSLTDFVEGFSGGSSFSTETGDFVLTDSGFRQLGSYINFPGDAILRLKDDHALQKSVLRHVVADHSNEMINLRVTGSQITDVLSAEHVLLKNSDIVMSVYDMAIDGRLPNMNDIKVGPSYVSKDGREFSARLLAPEVWNYDLGNGKPDPVYGSLFLRNSEKGSGAFVAGAAIARVSCFNWTIGKYEMRVEHRYASQGDFIDALANTAGLIDGYSRDMVMAVASTRDHRLERPELIFEKVAQRLGLPMWSLDAGRKYFDNETEGSTVFDVVQSITRASQVLSDPGGRRKPRWGLRETVEQNIMALANEIILNGEDKFVTTVGDVIAALKDYDGDMEAVGFNPRWTTSGGRELIINNN